MDFVFNGKNCEISVSICQNGGNIILEKIPVYSAGFKHCGDGGCKDIYKISVDLSIDVEGSCDDGGWDYRKTLYTKDQKCELYIDGGSDYVVGGKMYRPRLYMLRRAWEKTDYPEIEKYIELNNEAIEKLENEIDLTKYVEEYKNFIIEKDKELEEQRKIEKEEEKKEEENMSIGDYNSSWG